ncbi:MAG: hypothetical protein AAFQ98_00865, partial [Bacteroidota bacterium]
SRSLIQRTLLKTGVKFPNGDRLIAFKEYCNLPPEFYLYASDYEFLITIRKFYTRFQQRPLD